MIHKKEWTTCDRCGADINETPSSVLNKHLICRKICSPEELKVLTVENKGHISNTELLNPEVTSVEIVEYYSGKWKTVHLCGKCRKDFRRFMGNGI